MTTGQQEKDEKLQRQRNQVLDAVARGLRTAGVIQAATGLEYRQVDRALQALRKQKKLLFRTAKQAADAGSSRIGWVIP